MGPFEYKFITIIILAVLGVALIVWAARLLTQAHGRGDMEAEGHGFSIKLANYGPGVIVFVLGFVLLIFCVTRSFKDTTLVITNTTVVQNQISQNGAQITTTTTTTSETREARETSAHRSGRP